MNIRIKGISKSFGKQAVLKDITLTVYSGEILCLLGPSGAGKTTLVRLITGSISPNSGEIFIDTHKVPHMSSMYNIGFMPQRDALYQDISGYDNVLFFAGLYGLSGSELKKRVDEVLKLVDLIGDRDKTVAHYSGGMKKRLSLAIALVHQPEVLILDEPTVGIDPVLRREIWNEFDVLRNQGRTIIVTTHIMDEAMRCQKAALIYNGSLIAYGNINELVAKTSSGSIEELFFKANEGVKII